MKILHTGDIHLGDLAGPTKDGQNLRREDTIRCMREVYYRAFLEEPDVTIIAGDLFNRSRVWADTALGGRQRRPGAVHHPAVQVQRRRGAAVRHHEPRQPQGLRAHQESYPGPQEPAHLHGAEGGGDHHQQRAGPDRSGPRLRQGPPPSVLPRGGQGDGEPERHGAYQRHHAGPVHGAGQVEARPSWWLTTRSAEARRTTAPPSWQARTS